MYAANLLTVLITLFELCVSQEQSILQVADRQTFQSTSLHKLETSLTGYKYGDLSKRLSHQAGLHVRGSDGYDELTLRWQSYKKPDFDVVVAVATEQDIIETVQYANSKDQAFMAVTSGHGVTSAMSHIKNGIQISLKKLDHVKIHKDGQVATIGGGIITHELTRKLFKHNKRAVVPVAECIGIVGPALGGGHGYLQGQYGLLADQIISARLVLWNGTVVNVSENENKDLFWALRGAGHNFGIVSEIQYKIHDVPGDDRWSSETLIYHSEKLEDIFQYSNELLDKQPANMIHFIYFPNIPDIDPEKPVIMVIAIMNDSPEKLSEYTKAFHKFEPLVSTSTELPYPDIPAFLAVRQSDLLCQKRSKTHASVNFPIDLYKFNVSTMRSVYDKVHQSQVEDPRLVGSVMLIEGFGVQAVQAIDATSTAVPFRKKRLLLSPAVIVPDNGDERFLNDAMNWGRDIRELLRQGSSQDEQEHTLAYVNYALGDEGPKSLYGDEDWRQERLIALKQRWDPHNVFGSYGPIPLE